MKTLPKPFACWRCGLPKVFSLFLCALDSARAQPPGECTEQLLGAPTESTMSVRLTGVSQWPANPICVWGAGGIRADGNTYNWTAVLVGDGIYENPPDPTTVNVAVVLRYEELSGARLLGYKQLGLDYFFPYPSQGFTTLVNRDAAILDPGGNNERYPPLSFQGSISLDEANNLTVDITFMGGTADGDGDTVLDGMDRCSNTPPGAIVNEHGCSIDQLVPCAGPATGGTWRNHGQFVLAVLRTATAFQSAGLITRNEKKAIVLTAVRSDCGAGDTGDGGNER